MKKTVLYCMLLAVIAAFFSSCPFTYKMVVDENVFPDQTVPITFGNNERNWIFYLKEWNSTEIKEELYNSFWGVSGSDKTELTVPAGNNSFIFDMQYQYHILGVHFKYQIKSIELKYDLEQGKKYHVKGILKSLGSFEYEVFVGIFDVTGKQEILLKEWKLGEFKK